MTYGEANEDLRHALVEVMRERAPERWLHTWLWKGNDGEPLEAEPPAVRGEDLIEAVQVFRATILRYVSALTDHVVGTADQSPALRPLSEFKVTLDDLKRRGGLGTVAHPSLDLLTTEHIIPLVDAWRRAAVAAVVAHERELPLLADLPHAMQMVVARDAGQYAVALLRLDGRYGNVEGWKTYATTLGPEVVRRVWVAADVARGWPQGEATRGHIPRGRSESTDQPGRSQVDAFYESEGLVVDHLGYQPPPRVDPASPVAVVIDHIQASNQLIEGRLPAVSTLRYLCKGHQAISDTLARTVYNGGQHTKFEDLRRRGGRHHLIADDLKNTRSGVAPGDREFDVAAGHHLRDAFTEIKKITTVTHAELTALSHAFDASDRVVSEIVLGAVKTSWLFETSGEVHWYQSGVIKKPSDRWQPVTEYGRDDLVEAARAMVSERWSFSAQPASARERAWFAAEIERTEPVEPTDDPVLEHWHPRAHLRSLMRPHPRPDLVVHFLKDEAAWQDAENPEVYEPAYLPDKRPWEPSDADDLVPVQVAVHVDGPGV